MSRSKVGWTSVSIRCRDRLATGVHRTTGNWTSWSLLPLSSGGCPDTPWSSTAASKITWSQPCAFGDSSEHPGPDLVRIMKRVNEVRPVVTREDSMRAGLALDRSTDSEQRGEHSRRASTRPRTHAAANVIVANSGLSSPCSRRSATTRSARACARAVASACVAP